MKLDKIVELILDPKIVNCEWAQSQYYEVSKILEIFDRSFKPICTVFYDVEVDSNKTQYSTRYNKHVSFDKNKNGLEGEYIVHVPYTVEKQTKYNSFRIKYGSKDWEGLLFQQTLISDMKNEDILGVEKIIKITEVLMNSEIENIKIEFHALDDIEE